MINICRQTFYIYYLARLIPIQHPIPPRQLKGKVMRYRTRLMKSWLGQETSPTLVRVGGAVTLCPT